MQLKIKFFGKSKELSPSGNMILNFDSNILVSDLRRVLIEKIAETYEYEKVRMLINDCAFGNSERVLQNDDLISTSENLVLLPPVCGG